MTSLRIVAVLALLAVAYTLPAKPKPTKLTQVWASDTTLRIPESVLYDAKTGSIYVANIDGNAAALDGVGFISKMDLDGNITKLHWTNGLNAPKGMGVSGNRLYVADVYRLVAIDIRTGQVEKTWDVADTKTAFLNDVSVGGDGTVYVSDNRNSKLYRLQNDKFELWMEGDALGGPNGVLVLNKNQLLIGSTKFGALQALDVQTKNLRKLADGMGNTDGIVEISKGNYLVSEWAGRIFHVTDKGEKTLLLDTTADKTSAADIWYVPGRKLVLVPTFAKNRVVAYRVE